MLLNRQWISLRGKNNTRVYYLFYYLILFYSAFWPYTGSSLGPATLTMLCCWLHPCPISFCFSFCPISPTGRMFIAVSHWSDSRLLVFGIPSLGWALIETPLGYPVVSVVMEILLLSFCGISLFAHSNRSKMVQLLGWDNTRPRMCLWVVAELVGQGHWDHPLRWGA